MVVYGCYLFFGICEFFYLRFDSFNYAWMLSNTCGIFNIHLYICFCNFYFAL